MNPFLEGVTMDNWTPVIYSPERPFRGLGKGQVRQVDQRMRPRG